MAIAAYTAEAIIYALLTCGSFIVFTCIVLSMRFTPVKKVPPAKKLMVALSYFTIFINIPRCLDPSSVYGIIGFRTIGLLHNIVTVVHLYAVIIFIRSIAKTLYMQMQMPAPKVYTYTLIAANTFYGLAVLIVNPLQYKAGSNISELGLYNGLKGVAFDIDVALIMIIELTLYFRLRSRLLAFIGTVERQQARSNAASLMAPRPLVKAGSNVAAPQQSTLINTAPVSPAMPSTPANGDAVSPLPLDDDAGNKAAGDRQLLPINEERPRRSSDSGTDEPFLTQPAAEPQLSPPVSPLITPIGSPLMQPRRPPPPSRTPSGSPHNSPRVAPYPPSPQQSQSPLRTSLVRIPTSPAAGPSSSPPQMRRASTLAAPNAAANANANAGVAVSVSGSSGGVANSGNAIAGGSVSIAIAPSAISSHDQRVQELRNAVRTLNIISVCVVVIVAACLGFDLPGSIAGLTGDITNEEELVGWSPDDYALTHSLMAFVQQINLIVIAWYCWSTPLFLSKYRAPLNIGFVDGLLYGVESNSTVAASRYEPASKHSGEKTRLGQSTRMLPPPIATPIDQTIGGTAGGAATPNLKQAWSAGSTPNAIQPHATTPKPISEETDEASISK